MHSTDHESSGTTIHHNGDYSGNAIINVANEPKVFQGFRPDGTTYWSIEGIPCEALAQIGRAAAISEIVNFLEGMQ